MRINLFTLGDCTDINTWSGLPYYFYQNLLNHSVTVRPISLIPSESVTYRSLGRLMALRARAMQFVCPQYESDLFRTKPYHMLANRQLRSVARQHTDVDLNVFLTFTYSSYQYAGVPVIHYCDRTYEHHLEDIGRPPTRNDREFIRIDQRNIENADLVLTTGQQCCEFIKTRYKPKQALCLRPGHSTDIDVQDPERLIAAKERSTDILFIGRGAHKRGVDILVQAFKMFNEPQRDQYTLHIVGVQPDELPEELRTADPSVRFYGYLDRNVPADLERYNNLMRSARLFIMPMRPGPFPGVIREVQLHCTPIIASNVSDNSETLINGCNSVLVNSLEPRDFARQIECLIHDGPRWRQLALNGHASRKQGAWAHTIEEFLDIVRDSKLVKR